MTHFRHYGHLHIPEGFERYWSKYPNGFTLLESIMEWVSQVDNMSDSLNNMSDEVTSLDINFKALDKGLRASWNAYKEDYEKDSTEFKAEIYTIINNWIGSIEPTIQDEVVKSMNEWLDDGTLASIINEDVFGMKANKVDLDTLETELGELETSVLELETTTTESIQNVSDKVDQTEVAINDSIGSKDSLPEWHKTTLTDSILYLDNYVRDNFIDITKEPWNVPRSNDVDATTALQYALDNVPIRKTIYMPNGTYKITSPIVINRELTIEGQTTGENGGTLIEVDFTGKTEGQTAVQLKSTAKNSNISNLYLKNITPEGTAVNGIGNARDTLALTHFNVSDLWVVGFSANFYFEKIYLSRFIRCYAINGYYGFNFLGECTSLIFETCYANKNTDNYRMNSILYSTFISCASDAAKRYGYELTDCKGLAFVGCGVETANDIGFRLVSGNKGIHFQAPFAHACGSGGAGTASMFQIENTNFGIVIDSAIENSISSTSAKTLSVVAGKNTGVTINNATTVLPIISNIPSMIIDGQRKCNVTPNGAEFKVGDIVYRSNFPGTGLYAWICTVAGTPGTWAELSV